MAVSWTAHRFSGGVLALDTANTVVLRNDASRSFDRFDDPAELPRFAQAASIFRADELGNRPLQAVNHRALAQRVIAMREATDRLFRTSASQGAFEAAKSGRISCGLRHRACVADGPIAAPGQPFGDPSTPIALDAALAVSALALLADQNLRRIRICANCGWLFLDVSRNRSRLWCDMNVCGNRAKAKRHYRRQRDGEGLGDG